MTEKQRRCDGRCYDANADRLDVNNRPKCRCICGGVNHGVGLEKAKANAKKLHIEFKGKVRPWTCPKTIKR